MERVSQHPVRALLVVVLILGAAIFLSLVQVGSRTNAECTHEGQAATCAPLRSTP